MIPPQLEESWREPLREEWDKPYLKELAHFLANERKATRVYPEKKEVFSAFEKTRFHRVKVVIIGQDPYHGPGQAHGLSFSVKPGIKFPPSLRNIFKELEEDLGLPPPEHGCLNSWAEQGVLMLNATLTVREGQPQSHAGKGWELFTDSVVQALARRGDPLIFVLWGKSALAKCEAALSSSNATHTVLKAPHPSPYSASSGFFGSKPFSKINAKLVELNREPIDWRLPSPK